jgi:aspartyl-tRNA(Asn)/glutamyl-tRNA(Gln) amidotransferase subunit A
VLNGIDNTIDVLREAGAQVEDIELPEQKLFAACARVIMTSEMYTLHQADLRTRLGEFDSMTVNRFVLGATVGASDYINAMRLRRILTAAVDAALEECDVLLSAIALSTAPPFDPPPNPSTWAIQASMFNVTGHPAISVPIGLGSDGMPLGVQVVGRSFDETTVLRVARAIEVLSGWAQNTARRVE